MYASTAEYQPLKSKWPPAAVSIYPRGMRSLSEAAGCRQRLHLWNRGSWVERLAEVGGIIIVLMNFSEVRWIRGSMKP